MTTEWATTSGAIVPSSEIRSRALDNDLVIYHPGTDDVTHLDPIARSVWEHLADKPSFVDLVNALAIQFDTAPETIAADIGPLLDEMRTARLITLAEI